MTARRINRRLFRRIQRHILAEPKRMDMDYWLIVPECDPRHVLSFPACGTIACMAGWARQFTEPIVGPDDGQTLVIAQRALGISDDQASWLFHAERWPSDYRERLAEHKPGTKGYAQVVSDFIDHFLETGE